MIHFFPRNVMSPLPVTLSLARETERRLSMRKEHLVPVAQIQALVVLGQPGSRDVPPTEKR